MSTIVKALLRNYYNADDSSKFDLDIAIKSLVNSGKLTENELIILRLTIDQVHYSEISRVVGLKKSAINIRLNKIAKKIADYLGVEYQDEKIIQEVKLRLNRDLTYDEEKFCWKVIRGGRPIDGVNIFNFRNGEHVTKRGKGKTKG